MAATAFPTESLLIEGAELRWFSPADDPNVGYGFCATCGSTLFHRSGIVDGTNVHTSVCAGSIDGHSGLRTSAAWFAADAADHVRLDDAIPTFDHQPPPGWTADAM